MFRPNLSKLAQRSALPFLAVALLGLVLVGVSVSVSVYTYLSASRELEADTLGDLEAVAHLKADAIGRTLAEQRNRADVLSHAPVIIDALAPPGGTLDEPQRNRTQNFLEQTRERANLENIVILNRAGAPVFAAQPRPMEQPYWVDAAKEAIATGNIVFIDFHPTGPHGIDLGIVAPVIVAPVAASPDAAMPSIGAVVLQIDASTALGQNFAVWPLTTNSGSMRIVRGDGKDILFIEEYAANGEIEFETRSLRNLPGGISERMLSGARSLIGPDRNGLMQIAASAPIAGTDWLVLATIQRDEATADASQLGIAAGIATVTAIAASIILAFFLEQRRRLHAALAEIEKTRVVEAAETQFRAVFEQAAAGIAILSPSGQLLRVNRRLCEMFGFTEDSILRQNILDLSHPEDRAVSKARIQSLLAQMAKDFYQEKRYLRADGGMFWGKASVHIVRKADGAPDYFVSIIEDLTERKHAEQLLRDSERRFRNVVESAPNAMVMIGVDGRIEFVNRQAEQTFGYAAAELLGLPIATLVPERFRDGHDSLQRAFLSNPSPIAMALGRDVFATRQDGGEVPVEVNLTPIASEEGLKVLATIVDVTERKAQEEALRRSEDQLHHAQKMEAIGTLTGGIAHDFNNILGVIVANLDLLRPKVATVGDSDELVGEAIDAALHGADLTRRLLAFARRQPLNPQPVILNDLVTSMGKLLGRTLGEDIRIVLDLAPDLGIVAVDPPQLEAAILNLATNARDAMPNGGRLMIATSNRAVDDEDAASGIEVAPGRYVLVEVSDTGTGIDAATLAQIFEPFFTTKQPGKGTGLGLSMVFGFVKQSGGHVAVQSEVGAGTTFRLYLPRIEETDAAAVAEAATAPARAGRGETILVVEDNAALREATRRALADLGYRTVTAANADEALALLADHPVDLLFSDVVMPGSMNGFALAEIVRARWPQIKIIMTSGFPDLSSDDNGSASSRPFHILSKPYRRDALAQVIRDTLDSPKEYF